VRNATVTEDTTTVLGMAGLISEEDMVTTDTAIMDMVTGDLITDDEIYFSTGVSDCIMDTYCEYLMKSAIN
jgi:hypothetical protein